MEWKLKRRKAFLPASLPQCVLPEDCCVVIEWTDATRAVAASMGDCGKKVGSVGSGPCWLSDKESTQLACERGRRGTRWYLPTPHATAYRHSTLGHHRPMRSEQRAGCWNGTEPDRTEWGSTFSPLACSARTYLPCPSFSWLLLHQYCQKCSSVETICTSLDPQSRTRIQRGTLAYILNTWRGLPLRREKEAARQGPPLPPDNPVLMPVQSM